MPWTATLEALPFFPGLVDSMGCVKGSLILVVHATLWVFPVSSLFLTHQLGIDMHWICSTVISLNALDHDIVTGWHALQHCDCSIRFVKCLSSCCPNFMGELFHIFQVIRHCLSFVIFY